MVDPSDVKFSHKAKGGYQYFDATYFQVWNSLNIIAWSVTGYSIPQVPSGAILSVMLIEYTSVMSAIKASVDEMSSSVTRQFILKTHHMFVINVESPLNLLLRCSTINQSYININNLCVMSVPKNSPHSRTLTDTNGHMEQGGNVVFVTSNLFNYVSMFQDVIRTGLDSTHVSNVEKNLWKRDIYVSIRNISMGRSGTSVPSASTCSHTGSHL